MICLSHVTGNANVRATAVGFVEANILKEFHVSIACFPGSFLDILGGISVLSEIRRRRFDKELKPYTHMSPFIELSRLLLLRAGVRKFTKHETGIFSVDSSIRNLDKKVSLGLRKSAKKGLGGVYAYEDGASFSFQEAKRLGLQNFYDLPTGYWRAKLRILEAEKKRFPEWQNTIPGLTDSDEKLDRKEFEIEMADRIFVASTFTASTLKEFPGILPPVEIIPYGFPPVYSERSNKQGRGKLPIKLLFVGSLSQQKGIVNLFKAVDGLGDNVSLTLVGRKPQAECRALDVELTKHHWIPSLPHDKILNLMREHDILIFPTLFDGFGLVVSEAMSQGTPVIATYNSAGPDLIEHGKNGWLIEAGSTSALLEAIGKLVANPSEIVKAGNAAMEKARLRPWSVYMKEISNAVKLHCRTIQ